MKINKFLSPFIQICQATK